MFRKIILIVVVSIFFTGIAEAQSQFGRYLGVLKHSKIDQDQLAKLDFIVSRQHASNLQLIAVLSFYFGDYDSKEYVSYHFDSVRYNIQTGSLIFDQGDQEISLIVDRFSGGQFEGRLRSVSGGDVGTIKMTQSGTAEPIRPLVQPLWGEYQGICKGVKTAIQIETQRSNGDIARTGNPFGTYETIAQWAEIDSASCRDHSKMCVVRVYGEGSYDFFGGTLNLQGQSRDLKCSVTTTGLECEGCSLQRTSDEGATLGPQTYPLQRGGYDLSSNEGLEPPIPGASSQLSGTYYGYVFHERLGVYQPVSLNMVTYQGVDADGKPALFVSVVSSLFFGDFDSSEYVTHKFHEKEYPLLSSQIVFERISGGVDAVIQLTQLGNGKARGVWNSVLFGRVGTFEVINGVRPSPPEGAILMAPLAGRYKGGDWNLDLRIVRDSTPGNTVNPFYPLNFKGVFRLSDITPNIRITGGTFDYYTGKINMQLENESVFTGLRNHSELLLKRPTAGVTRPLAPHALQPFVRVKPE